MQQQAREQTRLWASGVSGVRPILLIRIDAVEDLAIIRQLLRGHGYWSAKRFAVDLVILNERRASYMQDLQAAIEDLVRKSQTAMGTTEGSGQVFALRARRELPQMQPDGQHDALAEGSVRGQKTRPL